MAKKKKRIQPKDVDLLGQVSCLGGVGFGFWQGSFGAGAFAVCVLLLAVSFLIELIDILDG